MQQLTCNTPSYTIYEFKVNEPNKTVFEDYEEKHVRSQLDEIVSRVNGVDMLYANYMAQYESNPREGMLDELWTLSVKKRDLDMQKTILSERMLSIQNRIASAKRINDDIDVQSPTKLIPRRQIRSSTVSKIKSKEWSFDVYNYTRLRTLNKRKFVNPSSLFGESRDIAQYNYTYFNNQPSEDIQIFEYPIEISPLITVQPLKHIVSTKTTPPLQKPLQAPLHNKTQLQNKHLIRNEDIIQNQTAPMKKSLQTFPIQCPPNNGSTTTSSTSGSMMNSASVVHISDIINRSIDSRHVIIIRGLPGSGKSAFCQAFKEQELRNGHSVPRILSIDHFFMEDGVYEYDASMEPIYREELFKLFKRQVDEGFFSVILIDSINEKLEQFSQFYHYARINRFQPSILELKVSPTICAKRCEHKFNPMEIYKMADNWEETPNNFIKLDATSFLQDSSIEDVEMEDVDSAGDAAADSDDSNSDDDNEITASGFFKSKWDEDFEERKERLDGMKQLGHEHNVFNLSDFLNQEQNELYRTNEASSKRGKQVRWADFEELKRQKRRKELGFVAGYTDWGKIMSDDIDVAEAALVQVRYFVKDSA